MNVIHHTHAGVLSQQTAYIGCTQPQCVTNHICADARVVIVFLNELQCLFNLIRPLAGFCFHIVFQGLNQSKTLLTELLGGIHIQQHAELIDHRGFLGLVVHHRDGKSGEQLFHMGNQMVFKQVGITGCGAEFQIHKSFHGLFQLLEIPVGNALHKALFQLCPGKLVTQLRCNPGMIVSVFHGNIIPHQFGIGGQLIGFFFCLYDIFPATVYGTYHGTAHKAVATEILRAENQGAAYLGDFFSGRGIQVPFVKTRHVDQHIHAVSDGNKIGKADPSEPFRDIFPHPGVHSQKMSCRDMLLGAVGKIAGKINTLNLRNSKIFAGQVRHCLSEISVRRHISAEVFFKKPGSACTFQIQITFHQIHIPPAGKKSK